MTIDNKTKDQIQAYNAEVIKEILPQVKPVDLTKLQGFLDAEWPLTREEEIEKCRERHAHLKWGEKDANNPLNLKI